MAAQADPLQTLGKYTLLERLGAGSMADVYLSRHPVLNRPVAIKVLRAHMLQQRTLLERFRREAQVIASLRHPNIVQVYDFDLSDEGGYLVMEYVAGSTLAARLQVLHDAGQHMSFDEVWRILTAMASAVDCAHRAGVVHRDLKPANVLLRSDGTPVLTDFGLVHLVEGTHYTQVDSTLGTPAYMSPEQCDGRPVDARSDIYALGVILFEMLTGQLPFSGEHPVHIILKHLNQPPPRPGQFRPDLPSEVEAVILRALSKSPDDRFSSIGEMLSALPVDLEAVSQSAAPVALYPTPTLYPTPLYPTPLYPTPTLYPTPLYSTPTLYSTPLPALSPQPSASPPLAARPLTSVQRPSLHALPEDEFFREVKAAFTNYDSLLELARSPLAESALIAPALVLNEAKPTVDDRGRALRLVLRWAVSRLAPSSPRHLLGTERPLDDPTWQDPLWRRYNILRHRYLEPLAPDDLLQEHGPVGNLRALVGIPGRDRFDAERDRALRDVALLLREQLAHHDSDQELRQMALEEICQPLKRHGAAWGALGLAATFRTPFPRTLLIEMAAQERVPGVEAALDYLIEQRLLTADEKGARLQMPPVLQEYVYARQTQADLPRRHERAAQFYLDQGQPLQLAWHYQRCDRPVEAADVLLRAAEALMNEPDIQPLHEALAGFTSLYPMPDQLPVAQWRQVQLLHSDVLRAKGDCAQAIQVCRRALGAADDQKFKARCFQRLGKLHEDRNPLRALGFYEQAIERLAQQDPEWAEAHKDRAWLYIKCQEWEKAQADLQRALEHTPSEAIRQRADIYDALASLYRRQKQYDQALVYARQALNLREESGDLPRIADSCNNMGNIHVAMGQFGRARASFEEALATHRRLGNQARIANALLNIGTIFYHEGRYHEAIERYGESLKIFQDFGLPREEAQARYNLAEAWIALGQFEEASRHWLTGYTISQNADLDDQLEWFEKLRKDNPSLQPLATQSSAATPLTLSSQPVNSSQPSQPLFAPHEQKAIKIAWRDGLVTSQTLMKEAYISKSTATRTLQDLTERGLLVRIGQGRGTRYVASGSPRNPNP